MTVNMAPLGLRAPPAAGLRWAGRVTRGSPAMPRRTVTSRVRSRASRTETLGSLSLPLNFMSILEAAKSEPDEPDRYLDGWGTLEFRHSALLLEREGHACLMLVYTYTHTHIYIYIYMSGYI